MASNHFFHSILNNIFAAPRAFTATTGVNLKASLAIFAFVNIFVYSALYRHASLRRDLLANIGSSFLISSILLVVISYVFYYH